MDDQGKTKEQVLEELRQTRVEIERLKRQAAENQAEPESRYRDAIRSIPDMMFWYDAQGVFVDYKAAEGQESFIPPEVFLGKRYQDIFPPQVVSKMEQASQAACQTRTVQVFEYALPGADGEDAVFEARVSRLDNNLLYSVVRDVSTRQKVQQQLDQERNLLRTVIDALPDSIYVKDRESRFLLANNYVGDLMGSAPDGLIGKTDYQFFPNELANEYYTDEQRLMDTGQSVLAKEERTQDAQGRERWLLTSKVPLRDSSGNIVGVVGTGQDITQRKHAEERTNLLSQVADQSLDGLAVVDMQGTLIYINAASAEMHGYTVEECLGQNLSIFQNPEQMARESGPAIQQVMEKGSFQGEMGHCRKDGSTFPTWMSIALLRDEQGRPVNMVATAQDITTRKQQEELLARRAEQLAMVSEVSAAISTILSPDEMLQKVVDLTKERFHLYHAHVYLLNEAGDTLVLTKGSGEVGHQMEAERRSISMRAEQSLVAQTARNRVGTIVNDVQQDPAFLPHPLLPNTCSELAVPIVLGDTLMGVLDVQGDQVDQFTQESIRVLSTLASQVAVALQNARQYTRVQESERLTSTVINATPDWIFIKDREHRYRLVNQGYANSLHIPVEDFIGKTDLDLGFPEELVKGNPKKGIRGFWSDDFKVMESGETQHFPNDPATIDGKVHFHDTYKTPLRDASGNIWGVLGFARDMTERQELEEALAHERTVLAQAMEAANMVNWELDAASQQFIFNDAFYKFLGTSIEEQGSYMMSGPEFSQKFSHPDSVDLSTERFLRALTVSDPDYRDEFETLVKKPDGGYRPVMVTLRVEKDAQGQTVRLYGTNQDITDVKLATEELRRTELLYRQVLNSLVDMVLVKGEKSQMVWANKAFREYYGMSNEQLKDMIDAPIVEPDVTDKYVQDDQYVLGTGKTLFVAEEPIVRYDGKVTPVQTIKSPIFDENGKAIMTVGVFRDITEAKRQTTNMEALYRTSRRLNEAPTMQEMLAAVVEEHPIPGVNRATVFLLNRNEQGVLESMLVAANWYSGTGMQPFPVGTRFGVDHFSSINILQSKLPVFHSDAQHKSLLLEDPAFAQIMKMQQIASIASVPMWVGNRQIGTMVLMGEEVHDFTQEEVNAYPAIVSQLAVAVENRRLFEVTQTRMRQEQVLREITARVRNSMDPDTILRSAVRELGEALGRPAFVRMGSAEQLVQKGENVSHSETNGEGGK